MVVCQYFLQGRCRFGQSCRYEHPNEQKDVFQEQGGKIYDAMMVEVIAAERGQQWPLSCFAPFRGHPAIPKLEDTSPEELRFLFHTAKNDGRMQDYLNHFSGLLKQNEKIREFLKQPSQELGQLLEEILSKKDNPSSDSNPKSFVADNGNKASIFGGGSAISAPEVHPSTNIFSRPPGSTPVPTSSIFGGAPTQGNSIFSAQTTTASCQPIFAALPATPQNIFSNPQPAPNLFQSVPTQNIFQSQDLTHAGPSPFAPVAQPNIFSPNVPTQNIFGGNLTASISSAPGPECAENVYSKMEDLTEEEKNIYMTPMFSFGKIPLKPPPESLC